jgi:hypothetical protein
MGMTSEISGTVYFAADVITSQGPAGRSRAKAGAHVDPESAGISAPRTRFPPELANREARTAVAVRQRCALLGSEKGRDTL